MDHQGSPVCICTFSVRLFSLECKFHEGRDFCLLWLLLYPQCLEQCLAKINICWVKGYPYLTQDPNSPLFVSFVPAVNFSVGHIKRQSEQSGCDSDHWAFVSPSLRKRGWAGDLKRPFQPHHSTNLRVFSRQKFLEDKINPLLNQRFPSLHVTCQGNFSLMLMWCGNLSHLPSLGTSSPEIER